MVIGHKLLLVTHSLSPSKNMEYSYKMYHYSEMKCVEILEDTAFSDSFERTINVMILFTI